MKTYWDTSAIVLALTDANLRERLADGHAVTRTHTLAELFSALTKGTGEIRLSATDAAAMVASVATDLAFVDLTSKEVLLTLEKANKKGVRGGRVHDLLHAAAADKANVARLLTADQNDFLGLAEKAVPTTI